MGLEPDARLVLNEDVDLRSLSLTPTDFFVYSRIRALGASRPTVADIVAASGQTDVDAETIIAKLIELGTVHLETPDEAAAPEVRKPSRSSATREAGRAVHGGTELRARAKARKRELLAAQMRALRDQVGAAQDSQPRRAESSEVGDSEVPLPVSRPPSSTEERAPGPRSILDEVEPVAETDPRLVADSRIDLDRQRRMLALRDRLRHIGHFELLGLAPTDDPKQIRRAYHVVSREFHPDSFYSKELGSFRGIVDDLFRRARASYEFLLDAERRRPLVEAHEAERRAEDAARNKLAEAARQEQARRAEQAQQARAERDKQRHERIKDRALAQRRKQAAKHASQARREIAQGRYGTAATLFRLAYEQDPTSQEYEQAWRESLATARRSRGALSYKQAVAAADAGNYADAARHFATAADADPTLRHLADAADAMADYDGARARKYAVAALNELDRAQSEGLPLDREVVARTHVASARAFASVGDAAKARHQAELAHALAPSKATQTLLNSIKVP